MKKIFLQIVALVLSICVLTACGSSNSSIEEDTVVENEMDTEGADEQNAEIRELSFQIGHIDAVTDDDHADVLCRAFADKAAELSDGKIQIEVIGAAALGNEAETVEGMALGTISAAIIGNTILTGYVPDLEIFDLPYLVTNREEAAAIFNNKEIMSYFDDQVYDIASIKILARGECGFRNYVSNVRPITQLSDLNGIKIRTMEGTIPVATWNALGANATPMAWSETYTAYVQGTIDAVELPYNSIVANGFDQISAYCSTTNHQYSQDIIALSASFWESLNESEQALLQEAADYAAEYQIGVMEDTEEVFIDEMAANGCVVNKITDFTEFIEATEFLYDEYAEDLGDIYTEILEAVGR